MLTRPVLRTLSTAMLLASATLFVAVPVHAQDPPSPPGTLETEVAAVRAENAVLREQLRRLEEQQKTMLDLLNGLKLRVGEPAPAIPDLLAPLPQLDAAVAAQASVPPATADASALTAETASQANEERFRDGMIIWQTPEDARVPFLLKFNNDTQLRYLNTTSSNATYTDHLGVVREVHRRNDITVNRSMFTISGYIFDERMGYSLKVWTAAGAASIIVTGNLSWRFSEALTLTGGYTGVPGSRSLVATFPYFQAIDRTMADNFFRPGFTQGAWVTGEPVKGLMYMGFVGNGLNTLNVSATKIDTSLALAGSVWWEPLGPYGEPGKSRNMYDDYFSSNKARIRIGTSFTRSREDRFSNLEQSSPDNTALHNSDGVLTFSTGAFALGVTVEKALYEMWAIDGGFKWNGFSVNGAYFMRWLNDFVADGPLPLASTFDRGAELSAGYFVVPKKWALYARASGVLGQFRDSYEYGAGARWYFLPTERVWLNPEVLRVNQAPYGGAFTPYTAGMNGWVPMLQWVLAF